jgi:hypothetical protein
VPTYYVSTTGNNANAGTSEATAWADLGYAASVIATGDTIFIKAGTYTLTTTSTGAGGRVSLGNISLIVRSYTVTPGDDVGQAILDCAGLTSFTVIGASSGTFGNRQSFNGIRVDGNGNTGVTGFAGGNFSAFNQCHAQQCVTGFSVTRAFNCAAVSCSGTGYVGGAIHRCIAVSCAVGFSLSASPATNTECVAANCTTGFTSSGFYVGRVSCLAHSCVTGFSGGGVNASSVYANCLAVNCSSVGFSTQNADWLLQCGGFANASNFWNAPSSVNFRVLAANPAPNSGSNDYTLTTSEILGFVESIAGSSVGSMCGWLQRSSGGSTIIVIED